MNLLDAVHHVEDFLTLAFYLNADALAELIEFIGNSFERCVHLAHVDNHHHVEILLHDGLGDIEDVDVFLCQIGANFGDDTFGILAYYCNNRSVHVINSLNGMFNAAKLQLFWETTKYKIRKLAK